MGDYLSFFDGRDLQSQQIRKLDKNYNKKEITISSTGKDMLVQFLTDDQIVWAGFRAYFYFIPIEPNCANWLNMKTQLLKSPDYPTIDCYWVVTAPSMDSTIVINFETFEVNFFSFIYLQSNNLILFSLSMIIWNCMMVEVIEINK